MPRHGLITVLTLVVAITACGGGSGDAAVADAIADRMLEEAGPDAGFEPESAACFGSEVVDRIGVDRLGEIGLSVEEIEAGAGPDSVELSGADLDGMIGALTTCVDLGHLLIDDIVAEFDLSEPSTDCLATGVNDADFLRAAAESSLLGEGVTGSIQDDLTKLFVELIPMCLTDDELESLLE